ncbi:YqaE/Pmp3 family membrane protein [Nostoc sp.]|uniref:YqaE/Pmp3 family membrane protein n=2 Tax=Nostoc sp. TaxID=1180 RepID=UPI002FFBB866
MKLVRFILGLLVPPLGVFLTVGVGPTLIINIVLTVLGWLPGSIHAIWVIAKHEEQVNQEGRIY